MATEDNWVWEARTRHTTFENAGELRCVCTDTDCRWAFMSRSQSSATAAAKRHVDSYPSHNVITSRTQTKMTYRRRVKGTAS